MRSRLGTLLVREGLLTPAQHLEAVEHAEDREQLLITSILQLGYVSEDRLVDLFREQLLVPVANPAMLSSPPPGAIAVVPAQMAREFLLCPCGEDAEGSLLVAMADASDTHALDELTYHTGRRVVRYVATERAIRWAVGRHYGLDLGQPAPPWSALPSEEIVLLTKVKVPGKASRPPPPEDIATSATAPRPVPLLKIAGRGGAPDAGAASDPAPSPAPKGRSGEGKDPHKSDTGRRRHGTLLGVPARDLQRRIADPSAYSGTTGSPSRPDPSAEGKWMGGRVATERAGQVREPGSGWPSGPAGLWSSGDPQDAPEERSEALGQALAALKRAQHRDDVGRVMLKYFEAFYLNIALLVVRGQRLVGWGGGGIRLHPDRIPGLDISLAEPSTLRDTVLSRLVYRGPMGRSPTDAIFEAQLGYAPESLLLVPIQVHKQVIAVLCADSPHTRLPKGELDILLADAEAVYESVQAR